MVTNTRSCGLFSRITRPLRCTAEQAVGGLGLEAQRAAVEAVCRDRSWELVQVLADAGVSSTARSRPALEQVLAALEGPSRRAEVLVVAKLDRLARSLPDYARLVERADARGWRLLALDAPEANTPQGEAMQAITAVFAQLERRLIAERTKEALAAARARGVRLGRPFEVTDETVARILALYRKRWPALRIVRQLEADGVPAPRGGARWHHATVAAIIRRSGGRLRRGRPRKRR